ncbi:unnamed protein product [Sympodiomycopsis kandeliae]
MCLTELRKVATSEHVCQILCREAGYLQDGQTLQDLQQPIFKDSNVPALQSLSYTAYQVAGRKEAEHRNYRTLLSETLHLNIARKRLDLSPSGGSLWLPMAEEAFEVYIDHLNGYLISKPRNGDDLIFHDLKTGDCLRTIPQPDSRFTKMAISHGWIVERESYGFKLNKIIRDQVTSRPSLLEQGTIERSDSSYDICFKFPIFASISAEGRVTFFNVVTKTIQQRIRVPLSIGLEDGVSLMDFDDDHVVTLAYYRNDLGPPSCPQIFSRKDGKLLWTADWGEGGFFTKLYSVSNTTSKTSADSGSIHCHLKTEIKGIPCDLWPPALGWAQFCSKTQTLCCLTDSLLLILPDYPGFVRFNQRGGVIGLLLNDQVDEGIESTGLAVADGTAVCITDNKIIMVDIASILRLNESCGDGSAQQEAITSSVQLYKPQLLQGCHMKALYGIAITQTHLAFASAHSAILKNESDSEEGEKEHRTDQSTDGFGVVLVDFRAMRDVERAETGKWKDDERRKMMRVAK